MDLLITVLLAVMLASLSFSLGYRFARIEADQNWTLMEANSRLLEAVIDSQTEDIHYLESVITNEGIALEAYPSARHIEGQPN